MVCSVLLHTSIAIELVLLYAPVAVGASITIYSTCLWLVLLSTPVAVELVLLSIALAVGLVLLPIALACA